MSAKQLFHANEEQECTITIYDSSTVAYREIDMSRYKINKLTDCAWINLFEVRIMRRSKPRKFHPRTLRKRDLSGEQNCLRWKL
jgi:hypothetical protein